MAEIDEAEFDVRPSDKLQEITAKVSEAFDLDMQIAEIERQLELKSGERKILLEKTIPELMASANIDVVSVPGTDVLCEVVNYAHASIPVSWEPAKQKAAFNWLEENGHGDLIKNTMIVEFNTEDADAAKRIFDRVKQMVAQEEINADPVLQKRVHHGSLSSFVKEQLKEGVALPLETLGAQVGEYARFKEKKDGKKGKTRSRRS